MKVRLCTINARGGSKGVPGKNAAIIAGAPLIAHSIRQAFESDCFEMVAVSSDSEELLDIALMEKAVAVKRPPSLATDSAPKIPSIVHSVIESEAIFGSTFDTIVDLDATSPLRTPQDICGAISMLETEGFQSVFSASESRRSPYFNLVSKDPSGRWGPAVLVNPAPLRRQDTPKTFDMNASIYVWNRDDLLTSQKVFLPKTGLYLMPEERSIDIDSTFDFKVVSWLLENREKS
jgi:CMP-N,N'-diacetyllegionaminic acid synthase